MRHYNGLAGGHALAVGPRWSSTTPEPWLVPRSSGLVASGGPGLEPTPFQERHLLKKLELLMLHAGGCSVQVAAGVVMVVVLLLLRLVLRLSLQCISFFFLFCFFSSFFFFSFLVGGHSLP